ncbi:MAG: phosphoribosylformylglycinamidine cyclo-ligase [Coriobacteriales bacterium]|nr:phosphoribosylformylglycinamidine cyclo-ligase [Coriobacteriales bacterium]MBQ6586112.1 phosphoribosylformylglycinamidine cyclo-ligase [Coriobacteriales bacterium]
MAELTYKDAGVDTSEGARAVGAIRAAVKSTYRPEVVGDIGGFGGLFSIAAAKDMADPLLVSGTDGVGTKLALAQRLDMHDTVGIDLVAMCANDILACGAEPLFFLDYVAIGKLRAEHVARIVAGIAEGCRQAGCSLIGGEMAEHPGVMDPDDYDLSGFCVGVVDRPKMLDPANVREGDVILGCASTGIHSNGFSLVRRALTDKLTNEQLLAPCDDLDGRSLGEALLAPTRIYVRSVLDVLAAGLPVHSLAHITGGGITENLDRALPAGLDAQVQLGSWPVLPIINKVISAAALSQEQALKTFNMGIGLCVICPPDAAAAIAAKLESAGEKVYTVGRIVASDEGPAAKGKVVYA